MEPRQRWTWSVLLQGCSLKLKATYSGGLFSFQKAAGMVGAGALSPMGRESPSIYPWVVLIYHGWEGNRATQFGPARG